MSGAGDSPVRQVVAAWQAAATIAAEWAERTVAVTAEAFRKLSRDPAIRVLLENCRIEALWQRRDCECPCAAAHPDDIGACDRRAVITRRVPAGQDGFADVPLCAPCAVAQGVAELPG